MSKTARGTMIFDGGASVTGYAASGGSKEADGPLGDELDLVFRDDLAGEDSWEKAESRILYETVMRCIGRTGLTQDDFDAIFTGDLLDQCIASTFGLRGLGIPHVGMYGACSTMALAMLNAAQALESGCCERCIAATSSHFASAERQYRMPLQYGGQRTPTAQWTVTGAGAAALGTGGKIRISSATLGIMQDLGVKDVSNMGAAMAPAAASTIERHLRNSGTSAADYDLILTGDLGFVGTDLLLQLLEKDGVDIRATHDDGGMMIYDREKQDVHAGGSGCGCSASVLCGHVLPLMERGGLHRVLFVGTGALLSPTSSFQGESIPSIAHAVELRA